MTPAPAGSVQVIELKNGTVLVGTIEREEGGKVHVRADHLGTFVIDASARGRPGASLPPNRPILLKNKMRIVGTIKKEEGGKLYIDAEYLGTLVVDTSAVARRP